MQNLPPMWVSDDPDLPDGSQLHPAVVEAVATIPLGKDGCFEIEKLLEAIKKIAELKYPNR